MTPKARKTATRRLSGKEQRKGRTLDLSMNDSGVESELTEMDNDEFEQLERHSLGHNQGHGKAGGWPATPGSPPVVEDEEEVIRDVTKIGLVETPASDRQTGVHQSTADVPGRRLFESSAPEESLVSVATLRKRVQEIENDDEKYDLLRTWFSERLQMVHGQEAQVAEAWDLAQSITCFQLR